MINSRIVFVLSCCALLSGLIWTYGYAVGKGKVWPSAQLDEAWQVFKSFASYGEFVPANRRVLAPEGAPRQAVTPHDSSVQENDGYYAVMGWNDSEKMYSVKLHGGQGDFINEWYINETQFLGDDTAKSTAPHAMHVMPDASLVVSFDWIGTMVRLDSCSNIVWSKDGYYHHSFDPASDGGIWTWYGQDSSTGHFQYVLKFDPATGDEIERIGLIEDVITRSEDVAGIFAVRTDSEFLPDLDFPQDIFHPNDAEELSEELAPAFPMFEAGDLLLSFRSVDLVAVIGRSGVLKWSTRGNWRGQHDADFLPDGTISVYNNNSRRARSEITIVDPKSSRVRNLTQLEHFASNARGKHQTRPNGNVIVTIPEEGRAIEFLPNGEKFLEFNNLSTFSDRYNEDLVNVKWYPDDYFAGTLKCE